MAELPRPSRAFDDAVTAFPSVRLQADPASPHLQRLDARAAVGVARRRHGAARTALAAAASDGTPAEIAPARAAVDDAAATLRGAAGVLSGVNTLHGVDVAATITVDVDIAVDGGDTAVRPRGELDLYTAPHLERACVGYLDEAPVRRLVVDLTDVSFLDSSGLAVLVELRRVCAERGVSFALTGLGRRTRRLLAVTRLDTVFDLI